MPDEKRSYDDSRYKSADTSQSIHHSDQRIFHQKGKKGLGSISYIFPFLKPHTANKCTMYCAPFFLPPLSMMSGY